MKYRIEPLEEDQEVAGIRYVGLLSLANKVDEIAEVVNGLLENKEKNK